MTDLTFGVELELADIECNVPIPEELGAWEGENRKNDKGYYIGTETSIINSDGTCADPLKETCTKGGEIHVVPSASIDILVDRIEKILKLFPEAKMYLPANMHVHVGLPEWTLEDVQNIYAYTEDNDQDLIQLMSSDESVQEFLDNPIVCDELKDYYRQRRRCITNPRCYEMVKTFKTKEELLFNWSRRCLYRYPKNIVLFKGKQYTQHYPDNHFRSQSVHIQHLFGKGTIEFRDYTPSLDIDVIRQYITFSKRYIEEALKGKAGKPIRRVYEEEGFHFPERKNNFELFQKWWEYKEAHPYFAPSSMKRFHKLKVV